MEKREALSEIQNLDKVPNHGVILHKKEDSNPEHVDGIVSSVKLSSPQDEHEYITGLKLGLIIGAVSLCCFLMLLDTTIVVTAIPRITSEFSSLKDIGWYGSSYLLCSCALQPMSGKLYKQFNSKWTFIGFLGVFELGSLLCGVAVDSKMLIVGRAVAGLGGAGLANGSITILSACTPLEKRAAYLGMIMGFAQLGVLFGPLIGGALTQNATWRWCFLINLPIGAIAAVILFFIHIPDLRSTMDLPATIPAILKSLDIPGFALFAPTAIMFLLALQWGGTTYAWSSSVVIGLFCGSAATSIVLIIWERKMGDDAMFPLSFFKQRIVWSSFLFMFYLGANLLTTSYFMAIYFQAAKGVLPLLSGVYSLPAILSQMFLAILSGALINRLGYYLPWGIICGILATIGSGLLSTLHPSSPPIKWIFYQIIAGIGRGCGMQIALVAVQNNISPAHLSVAMSVIMFAQAFGSALFIAFGQTILSTGIKNALPKFAPSVSIEQVIEAGATHFRDVIKKEEVSGVALAYSEALNHVFYLVTAAGFMVFVFSWGMGWKNIKKAKVVEPQA